jgi:citrate synthase
MPRATTDSWRTAIAEVHVDDVNIRGEWITDLIAKASFPEAAYLVLSGKRATPGQARVLDALFISCVDHGISPSSTVTRELASYGVPIQVGIAGGQLTVGDHHGGAGEQFAYALGNLVASCTVDVSFEEAVREKAREFVQKARDAKLPVHGFGHPQHGEDPRVTVLRSVADEHGVAGKYCLALDAIEGALAEAVGRRIHTNIDGISAALLLDLGLDPRVARPILMAPRVIGLAAHFIEEIDQGNVWRHVPNEQVTYTGAAARPKSEATGK